MAPISSDFTLNAANFDPNNVAEHTTKINEQLVHATTNGPKWYDPAVGVVNYRKMLDTADTRLGPRVYLARATDAVVPSRDPGRDIPVRVYTPDDEARPVRGVLLHFHGGGFVVMSHKHFDKNLQQFANAGHLSVVSVGYRLAPEDPHPRGVQDCFDVAEHLADDPTFGGGPLVFLAGESSGASLAALTTFHLRRTRPSLRLAGVVLTFGWYDLTLSLPTMSRFDKPLVLNNDSFRQFRDAYLGPDAPAERLRDPLVSPLYDDLLDAKTAQRGELPPALFLIGTEDALLDDTLLMSAKWMATGSEAVVKVFPGASHAFTVFVGTLGVANDAAALVEQFVREKVDAFVGV